MTTLSSSNPGDCINLRHKFQVSVEHLATGRGTLKERLKNVMLSYLLSLNVRDKKSKIGQLHAEALALATAKKDPSNKLGTLHVTLASSHWSTDRKIAEKILEAYELATKAYYEAGLDRS